MWPSSTRAQVLSRRPGFCLTMPESQLASVSFKYISVGGTVFPGISGETPSRIIIERFRFRNDKEGRYVAWSMNSADENVDTWLHAAQPLVVPENVISIVGSHWARGRPGTIHVEVDWKEARIHHYVDLVSSL